MTRWAFVSDIHGNSRALLSIARWCEAHGVDQYVCLGDVIGRGNPEGCVAWVRDHAILAIVGNRDLDYVDRVSADLQTVVRSWPHEGRAADFVVSHGDPRLHRTLGSHAIRAGFGRAHAYMESLGVRLWLFGHTHQARVWRLTEHGQPLPIQDTTVRLAADGRYVVNVGTTGMPRPGKGQASFVLYDDAARVIEVIGLAELRRSETAGAAAILVS